MYYKNSPEIDLGQLGLSGVLNLSSKDSKSKKQLHLGFTVSQAPAPYNKTIVLTIAPRCVLVNMLQSTVLVKQIVQGSSQSAQTFKVKSGDKHHEIHLDQTPSNCKTPCHIQFTSIFNEDSKAMPAAPDKDGNSQYWTKPFAINGLQDFQSRLIV